MLESEASAAVQRKGKSSEIVAPRLKTGENGQILLTLTPQLLADIFEEFPVVLQAYSDNVPNPVSAICGDLFCLGLSPMSPHVHDDYIVPMRSYQSHNSGNATSLRSCSTDIARRLEIQ